MRNGNMEKIDISQLSYDEREELKFVVMLLVVNEYITPEQEKFIYENLYRGNDGLAYAYLDFVDRNELVPITLA